MDEESNKINGIFLSLENIEKCFTGYGGICLYNPSTQEVEARKI